MRWKLVWKRPLGAVTQVVTLVVILFGIFVALDLNRRAQAGRIVGKDEETLQAGYDAELERQEELLAKLDYMRSEEAVSDWARNEGGYIKIGEKRIVILSADRHRTMNSPSTSATDPAHYARPWQAWWQLLTDTPMPTS